MVKGLDRVNAQLIVLVDTEVAAVVSVIYKEEGREVKWANQEGYPMELSALIMLQLIGDALHPRLRVKLLTVSAYLAGVLDRMERDLPPKEEDPF